MTIETAPAASISARVYLPKEPASSTPVRVAVPDDATGTHRGLVVPRGLLESVLETFEILQEEGALEEIRAAEADIAAGNVVSLSDARRHLGLD